jgi:hypothetical protein
MSRDVIANREQTQGGSEFVLALGVSNIIEADVPVEDAVVSSVVEAGSSEESSLPVHDSFDFTEFGFVAVEEERSTISGAEWGLPDNVRIDLNGYTQEEFDAYIQRWDDYFAELNLRPYFEEVNLNHRYANGDLLYDHGGTFVFHGSEAGVVFVEPVGVAARIEAEVYAASAPAPAADPWDAPENVTVDLNGYSEEEYHAFVEEMGGPEGFYMATTGAMFSEGGYGYAQTGTLTFYGTDGGFSFDAV